MQSTQAMQASKRSKACNPSLIAGHYPARIFEGESIPARVQALAISALAGDCASFASAIDAADCATEMARFVASQALLAIGGDDDAKRPCAGLRRAPG